MTLVCSLSLGKLASCSCTGGSLGASLSESASANTTCTITTLKKPVVILALINLRKASPTGTCQSPKLTGDRSRSLSLSDVFRGPILVFPPDVFRRQLPRCKVRAQEPMLGIAMRKTWQDRRRTWSTGPNSHRWDEALLQKMVRQYLGKNMKQIHHFLFWPLNLQTLSDVVPNITAWTQAYRRLAVSADWVG